MLLRAALTDRINHYCLQLETNPYLSQARRNELITEIGVLVEKRNRVNKAYEREIVEVIPID